MAAGNDAMSVANSYPEIFIGKGEKDLGKY